MDQSGFFIIYIIAIKCYSDGRIQESPVQVSKARLMMKQHKLEVRREGLQAMNYMYQWQAEREDWTHDGDN